MSAANCTVAPDAPREPPVRIGDLARAFGPALRASHALTGPQQSVLRALSQCRTAALGGHLHLCQRCGYSVPMYNSCGNRHCPGCQGLDQHRWLEQRHARILPTRYVHVVFTLPDTLRPWVRANRAVLFGLLLRAAADTLLTLASDPDRLGALPAITTVLHTWTRELLFHPHVHAIVSAGGLSPDKTRWVCTPGRTAYLFPVRVLAKVFRAKFRDGFVDAMAQGHLRIPDDAGHDALDRLRQAFYRTPWVVYAKAPFGGAEQVYRYLGLYTHRVGISNSRLRSVHDQSVTFATRDGRTLTLPVVEFLWRLLDHVLPKGFVKIRHYGLLAPCHATTTLALARSLLTPRPSATSSPPSASRSPQSFVEILLALTGFDPMRCPRCHDGRLVRVALPDDVHPATTDDTS